MSVKKLYLASPFFNDYELACVKRAEAILFSRGFEVFSPRLHEVRDKEVVGMAEWSRETFRNDRALRHGKARGGGAYRAQRQRL